MLLLVCSCALKPASQVDTAEPLASNEEAVFEMTAPTDVKADMPTYCAEFPFDMSGSACDIAGWQSYVYSQWVNGLSDAPGLPSTGLNEAEELKRLMTLAMPYQPLAIREKAGEELMQRSFDYLNAFGDFLYSLASGSLLLSSQEKQNLQLQSDLTASMLRNKALEKQLAEAKAKIEAIMEIEQDLSTEQETPGAQ